MDDCEFCQIIAGEQSAHILYVGTDTVAFLDAEPAIPGHTLVVPRAHQETVFSPEQPIVGPVFETVERVAAAMTETLEPDGFSVFHTSGDLVGHISHAHVHLLPRYEDDTVHLSLRREPLDTTEAARIADRLRAVLQE